MQVLKLSKALKNFVEYTDDLRETLNTTLKTVSLAT